MTPSFPFLNELLAKAVIRMGARYSFDTTEGCALQQYNWSAYVLRVLEAPHGVRAQVKDLAATSDSPGQKQLVAILTVFEILSPVKQAEYVTAFAACATLASQAVGAVAQDRTYQEGRIPPYQEP